MEERQPIQWSNEKLPSDQQMIYKTLHRKLKNE